MTKKETFFNKIPFVNYIGYAVLLFVWPKKLAKIDARRNLDIEFIKNEGFKTQKFNKEFMARKSVSFLKSSLKRIKELRKSAFKSIIITFIVFITCLFAAYFCFNIFGHISGKALFYIRLGSSFVILFAAFLKVGRPIHSMGGKTIPENLDEFLFRGLSAVGIGLMLITYFWEHIL